MDSQSAIDLAENPIQPGRNVHVHARYFYVRHMIDKQKYAIHYLQSEDNIPDMLVTYKNEQQFHLHRPRIMGTARVMSTKGQDIYEWH